MVVGIIQSLHSASDVLYGGYNAAQAPSPRRAYSLQIWQREARGGGESRVEARLRRGQKICFYTHYCVMSSLYFCMKLLLNKFGCGNPSVNDIALPVFPLIFLHCSRAAANTAEAEIVVRDEFSLGL